MTNPIPADRAFPDSGLTPTTGPGIPKILGHRPFAMLLVATGAIGWIASGILVLERLALYEEPGHITSCDINPWVSCGRVMDTWQSELFGFPNPMLGIVAFAVIITTGMVLLSGSRPGRWYWIGLQVGVTAGMVFVIWLWFQALFVIHVLCLYCMVVWAVMIPLFILLTVRNIVHGIIPAHGPVVRVAANWAWTLVAVAYVAVAASVFVTFFAALTGY